MICRLQLRRTVTSFLFLSTASCGSLPDPTGPVATTLTLYPTSVTLYPTQSVQLSVTLTGNLVDTHIQWTTSDPTVAVISPTGSIWAVDVGVTTITAVAAGNSATAVVVVLAPEECPFPDDPSICF